MWTNVRKFLWSPLGVAVVFVLFFSAWTKLTDLGKTPVGLSWDEAFIGYVGKMVITTGSDEYGRLLPRVFQSFGDYKAPLAVYIAGISTTLFGLTPWATRLPFALAGVASTALMMRLTWLNWKNGWLAVASGWLLAVTPWHFLFSRVAFESGFGVFFLLSLLVCWLELRTRTSAHRLWWVGAVLSVVLALYTYHANRIVFPLLLLLIAGLEWRTNQAWLKKSAKNIGVSVISLIILCLPLVVAVIRNHAADRATQTTIFGQGLSALQLVQAFFHGFFSHLTWQFLTQGQTATLRHGTGNSGVLLYSEFALLILGTTFILGRWLEDWLQPQRHQLAQTLHNFIRATLPSSINNVLPPWFWLAFAGIALLPAALGFEVPHANRSLLAVVPIIIIMIYGIKELRREVGEQTFALVVGCLMLFSILEFGRFYEQYFTQYRVRSAADWLDGYSQAVQLAEKYVGEGHKVKFTSTYGQPEIFFGFYQNIAPDIYRTQRVPHITFGAIAPKDQGEFDVLFAAPSEALPNRQPTQRIERIDGQPAFLIYQAR